MNLIANKNGARVEIQKPSRGDFNIEAARMISEVQDVHVYIQDMARAIYFYRDALGFELTDEDDHLSGLTTAGVRFSLRWTGGGAIPGIPANEHGPLAGAMLTFCVDDVTSFRIRLKNIRVLMPGEADPPRGKLLVFEDPDGNVLKLK